MRKLEKYCEDSRKKVTKEVENCVENKIEISENTKYKGRITGLTTLYLDMEEDLIEFFENGFTDKKPIEILKLKADDLMTYINNILNKEA